MTILLKIAFLISIAAISSFIGYKFGRRAEKWKRNQDKTWQY
jgi:hypothetical protein